MIAHSPHLLVVSDFDGTLAEFSTDPTNVPINQNAIRALYALAELPHTHVAILSGRGLTALQQVSGLHEPLILAGSHGAESTLGTAALTTREYKILEQVTAEFERLSATVSGSWVEHKPFHRVLHLIAATDKDRADHIYQQAAHLQIPGATIKPGKHIIEASVLSVTKGTWITRARSIFQPDAILFLGDDTTDEEGFAVLSPPDLGVKVGSGHTLATHRVAHVAEVGEFLQDIVHQRRRIFP